MEQFAELLREAAVVLGTEAARLWPQIVLVTYIKALAGLVMFLLLVGIGAVVAVLTFKVKDEMMSVVAALSIFIWVLIAACAFFALPGIFAGIFAPEGQTALNIINGLR